MCVDAEETLEYNLHYFQKVWRKWYAILMREYVWIIQLHGQQLSGLSRS